MKKPILTEEDYKLIGDAPKYLKKVVIDRIYRLKGYEVGEGIPIVEKKQETLF